MAPKPLNILKKGLDKFSKIIKDCKEALNMKLSQRETISSADEQWLDHEANTIDKDHIEIYQAVIDAIEAHENIKIKGGDDVDNDIPLDPRPTYRDVLKAVSTIHRYIDDLNDPIACKMEALLASFNMKLHLNESRSMKGTVLRYASFIYNKLHVT